MSSPATLAERLKEARTTAGMSQIDLAQRSGVSQSTIANIESGRNEGSKHIVKIAEALNHNVRWLVSGEFPRMVHNVRTVPPGEERLDPNLRPDAPVGTLPSVLADAWLDRSEPTLIEGKAEIQWIKVEERALSVKTKIFPALGTSPIRCRVIAVPDDSMEPFISRNDLFVIDLTRTHIREGRIYAVLFDADLLIRQAFKQAGGEIVLHAYNGLFPDKHVGPDVADSVRVLGEYVYRAGAASL